MNPWIADARLAIKTTDDVEDEYIEKTIEIETFLSAKSIRSFVTATKGLGKSLVLIAKRKSIEKRAFLCLPTNSLADIPDSNKFVALSNKEMSILKDENAMCLLWALSIFMCIIKNTDQHTDFIKKNQTLSEISTELLNKCSMLNVSDFMSGYLRSSIDRKSFVEILTDDYSLALPIATNLGTNFAIFMDNIDECFEKFADRDVWYISQTSLIKTMYDLRQYQKVRLFGSVRKEAYLKLIKGTGGKFFQYGDITSDLKYSEEDLKDIFVRNISRDKPDKIIDSSLFNRNNPSTLINAFVGANEIQHGYVDEKEHPFNYIYRHTLQRPRDLMIMGRAISECNQNERDARTIDGMEKFKSIVNSTAKEIGNVYMSEVIPHLSIGDEDFSKICNKLNINVLSFRKLKELCADFNGISKAECLKADCKTCTKTHIFCELYKIGLIGYVDRHPTEYKKNIQRFERVGEKTFDDAGLLPISKFYLVHPVLEHLVRKIRHIDDINIIGYDRIWNGSTKNGKEIINKDKSADSIPKSNLQLIDQATDLLSSIYNGQNISFMKNFGSAFKNFDIVMEVKKLISDKHVVAFVIKTKYVKQDQILKSIADSVRYIINHPNKNVIETAYIIVQQTNNKAILKHIATEKSIKRNPTIKWELIQ